MAYPESNLGITTKIGCSVNCKQYCPQEVVVQKYVGKKYLPLDDFKDMIETVPKTTGIEFAGICEPFLNPQCTDMIEYSVEQGHAVDIYSTLVGMTIKDAERLSQLPIRRFVLHLPDAKGIAHIPLTPYYYEVLGKILTTQTNILIMNMSNIKTSGHENLARGTVTWRKKGRVGCDLLYYPCPQLLPSGDVYMCCYDHAFEGCVGNLHHDSFAEIEAQYKRLRERIWEQPDAICHRCEHAEPIWRVKLLTGIMKAKRGFKVNEDLMTFIRRL